MRELRWFLPTTDKLSDFGQAASSLLFLLSFSLCCLFQLDCQLVCKAFSRMITI